MIIISIDYYNAKIRNNHLDWRIEDIERIASYYEFNSRLASGSHVTFQHPLSPEDGGGYLIEFPDLPGCLSDGETEEEAILMGKMQ